MAATLRKRRAKDIELSSYKDAKFEGTREEYERLLLESTTVYVGNLSYYTSEEQLYELFGKCGELKRVIMGLNRESHIPCGFCFVEFYRRTSASDSIRYISGTRLDDRVIRVDWDYGFRPGRQYGRGKTGGQVRDDFRSDYDPARGGYGGVMREKMDLLTSSSSLPGSASSFDQRPF